MAKLTLAMAGKLAEGESLQEIEKLDASKRGLIHVEDLSSCAKLTRLDLSHNSIADVGGLVHCRTLTWLNLSHNKLHSLEGIQTLTNLAVLSASSNAITTCGDLSPLKNLKALILSGNQLSVLTGLSELKELNTLGPCPVSVASMVTASNRSWTKAWERVLSSNCFKSISVEKLPKLTKLSLSQNSLRNIPDVQHNSELRELRVNRNKIATVPASLQLNTRLSLLDLGNNKIKDLSSLDPLRCMRSLKNLNLKGNKLCDSDGYEMKVLDAVPSVQFLDGRKRAAIVVNGGGKQTASIATPGILKKTPTPIRPGGSTSEGKKVRFYDAHSKETRGKRKLEEERRDECEELEETDRTTGGLKPKKRKRGLEDSHGAPEETDRSTGGLKPKKRKRELEDSHGSPQQKKPKVGGKTAVETVTESLVKLKNHRGKKEHVGKKKHTPDSGVDHGLVKISNNLSKSRRKIHKHKRQLDHPGSQSNNEAVNEDISVKTSLSPATAQYGVVPLSGKKKSKVKMHSGVVGVEEVKPHRRRKKRERSYSPTVLLQGVVEVGGGQETTWT